MNQLSTVTTFFFPYNVLRRLQFDHLKNREYTLYICYNNYNLNKTIIKIAYYKLLCILDIS